ncbi:STAS domain-containing protein [Halioxenophilus sp. WMMB6]|uniref:STAS domain-containing protein n=1 Tax=Halioxenophilus sp. WMMB6 TaxID=3073815 RepID=UPI00295F5B17|nr:STAS domain-containing protein [Halioxenophilus sp. WMMB6]
MQPGHIYVAEQEGVNVIKMVGDVRLTLCISFDKFIKHMFAEDDFASVVFDLRQAEAIDSTTLGLMAKISIICQDQFHIIPVVISPDEGINRLLESMGFDDIFEIVRSANPNLDCSDELPLETLEEHATKAKVLEAHKILMSLNENNRREFRDLVECLEQN